MKNATPLTEVKVDDVIVITNKDGITQDFGFVKEIVDIGFVVNATQRDTTFFRFDGTAPGMKLLARRPTEQEELIHRIRRTSAKTWIALGIERLREISTLLKNAEK